MLNIFKRNKNPITEAELEISRLIKERTKLKLQLKAIVKKIEQQFEIINKLKGR